MSSPTDRPDQARPPDPLDVLEALPQRVAVLTPAGALCYRNAEWGGLLGDGAAFLPAYCAALDVRADEREALRAGIEAVLGGGRGRFALDHGARLAGRELRLSLAATPYAAGGALVVVNDITERAEREAALRRDHEFLHALLDSMPEQIYFKDPEGRYTLVNRVQAQALGLDRPDAAVGKTDYDFYIPAICDGARRDEQHIIASGQPMIDKTEGQTLVDDATGKSSEVWVSTTKAPIQDAGGKVSGIVGITRDISERIRAEGLLRQALRQSEEQAEIIRAQSATLAELSTPLIPVSDDVMILPLVGAMDSHRAQQVIETMLMGVSAHRARIMVLDITGVPVVDTHVASTLLHAARAVGLLGARFILTGIRPEVAQTLVGLGADLGGITTYGSLRAGLARVLGR